MTSYAMGILEHVDMGPAIVACNESADQLKDVTIALIRAVIG